MGQRATLSCKYPNQEPSQTDGPNPSQMSFEWNPKHKASSLSHPPVQPTVQTSAALESTWHIPKLAPLGHCCPIIVFCLPQSLIELDFTLRLEQEMIRARLFPGRQICLLFDACYCGEPGMSLKHAHPLFPSSLVAPKLDPHTSVPPSAGPGAGTRQSDAEGNEPPRRGGRHA